MTILEDFVKEAKFDWLGVFSYSDEEGSGAFSLDGKIQKRTIESRKRRLMKLQQSISKRAKQQWIGRELVILAEGESEETPLLWEGRTEFHAPEIDGKVYINDFGDLRNSRTRPLLQSPDHRSPRLRRSRQNPIRPPINTRVFGNLGAPFGGPLGRRTLRMWGIGSRPRTSIFCAKRSR